MSNKHALQSNNNKKPIITRPKTRGINTSGRANRSYNYNNTKSKQPPRSKSAISYLRKPNTQELESIRQKLFENYQNATFDLNDYSTEELNDLLPFLRIYAHIKGNEEDYDNAQIAHLLTESINDELEHRNFTSDKEADEILKTLESQQKDFDDQWKQKFDDYDNDTTNKREELQKHHQQQLEAFEQMWAEDMPRKYRKPSPYLLQIKKIERSLASTNEFERAKQIHMEYEKQAQIEQEQAQHNLNRDYQIAQNKLFQKQQQELSNFEETRNHLRNLMNVKYAESRKQFGIRSRVLNQRKQQTRKGSRNKNSGQICASLSFTTNEKRLDDVLLPPLTAPNDPDLIETQQKKKREMNKKKLAYQKQNAQTTLARYTVDGQEFSQQEAKEDNQIRNTNKASPKTNQTTNNDERSRNEDLKGKADGGTDNLFDNLLQKVDDVVNLVEQDNNES